MNLPPLLCSELARIRFSFSCFYYGVRPIYWREEPFAVLSVGPWVLESIEGAAEALLLV
jgi:hypothetical protein